MSLLFRIVYAAHANGTHHKLALDALGELDVENAEKWRRVFLKHVELYLEGAKAPDKEFKDFKNHVLHPGDDYWGGAPEKVVGWYGHLVTALREKNWSEAAYCAGVLSHYYTDPVHPFHTAQSKAENAIHRAVEWTINRSYNALRREALAASHMHERPRPPEPDGGSAALKLFVCESADRAHQDYERLIVHYDINVGAVIPEDGFDRIGRATVGVLMLYAASGFAMLLSRAIREAGVAAPDVSLTAETVIAALKIPSKWVLKKMDDAEDRRVVEAMFDELRRTGDVAETLPEDDRVIRDLHAREVGSRKRDLQAEARRARAGAGSVAGAAGKARPRPVAASPAAPTGDAAAASGLAQLDLTRRPASSRADGPSIAARLEVPAAMPTSQPLRPAARSAEPRQAETREPDVRQPATSSVPQIAPRVAALTPRAMAGDHGGGRPARHHLELADPIVDAPSIGPKTAERLAPAGLMTVRDLMGCDPEAVAAKLAFRHITAATIRDWQDQARLVLEIPELRGTHAQLLVGGGFRSSRAIAEADAGDVCAGVLAYAQSAEGQRLLREGAAPDIEKIKSWCENAKLARAIAA